MPKTTEKSAADASERTEPTDGKTIAPVQKEETAIVDSDFERDAGEGFENTDQESYAVPFLTILQSGSPQVKETKPEYIEGAKEGMFYNSATGEIFDGQKGVHLVTADFQRRLVEWVPRDEGGGYVGVHPVESIDVNLLKRVGGKWLMDNGNELQDARNHMCLILTDAGPQPIIVRFVSTQIKKSRHWWTAMKSLKARTEKGKPYTPATYMSVWHFTTVPESNAKGEWMGFKFKFDRMLDVRSSKDGVVGPDADIYYMAKEFREQLADGRVKIEPPAPEQATQDEEDVPF